FDRVMFGFFCTFWIDNDEFFPVGIVRERNAHDVVGRSCASNAGDGFFKGKNFELHAFQFFERQFFEQRATSGSEVMLHRIVEGEEIAVRFLEAVAQSDQFLPTINRDQPAVLQVAFELLGLNSKIDNIGVAPDKWMERLDVGDGRSALSAAINLYRSRFTQLNRNDARHRVRTKKHPVLLQFHSKRCLDFARNHNSKTQRKVDRPLCWAMPNKGGFAATI